MSELLQLVAEVLKDNALIDIKKEMDDLRRQNENLSRKNTKLRRQNQLLRQEFLSINQINRQGYARDDINGMPSVINIANSEVPAVVRLLREQDTV
jgi:uncharacterized membrane protein YgaE (UPF0421/DUF939 family)